MVPFSKNIEKSNGTPICMLFMKSAHPGEIINVLDEKAALANEL